MFKFFKRKSKSDEAPIADKVWCPRCKEVSYARRFSIEIVTSGVKIVHGQCIYCGMPTKRIID